MEAHEIRQAIVAGFIKSRFWKAWNTLSIDWAARMIDWAARMIVLAATVYALLPGLLGRGNPDRTHLHIVFGITSPVAFVYVFHKYLNILVKIWQSMWGKILYAIVAPCTLTASKVLADQQIRALLHGNPSLFPSAQQLISTYNILLFVLLEANFIIWAAIILRMLTDFIRFASDMIVRYAAIFGIIELLGIPMKRYSFARAARQFIDFMALFWAFSFLALLVPGVESGFWGIFTGGRPFLPAEQLLVLSTFTPNHDDVLGSKICNNLDVAVLISPFNTSDPMPRSVLVAKPLLSWHGKLGRAFKYSLSNCERAPSAGDNVLR
ncbi:hypothetical protein [Rhodopila globiformis]|uniref:Uncharacterized protein n=1 Tax=Rhodopila globiformis TaxID=1071 RepID=A0A2S6MYE8_RHOGL|nr:hypothetical protein [Rhodopila globiformis]PPQ27380.1 hypothetical protein CCS01_27935 [Rhodopila globiformis]